jgi:hypothetical protein
VRVVYKGYEINVKREESLGGWDNVYYHIMRIDDGYFLEDSFSLGEEHIRDVVKACKQMVDKPRDYGLCVNNEECDCSRCCDE